MSVGLSSTRSTVRWRSGLSDSSLPLLGTGRKGEAEGGSFSGRRSFQPDAPAVLLHHTLAERQADTASRVMIAAVQAFEEAKDLFRVLRLDSNSIINHREYAPAITFGGSDLDTGTLLTLVLDGVADQILKYLGKPAFVDHQRGQFRRCYSGPLLANKSLQTGQNVGQDRRGINRWRRSRLIFRGSHVRQK